MATPLTFIQLLALNAVYANHDYEPYAKERDANIKSFSKPRAFIFSFKDQVILRRMK